MPNTLAHVGLQALATRAVAPATDLKWIYLGCIVPDLPWMAAGADNHFVETLRQRDARPGR